MMLADIQQNGMVALGSPEESNANENPVSINPNQLEETNLDDQVPAEQDTPNLHKPTELLAAADTNPAVDTPNTTRPNVGNQQNNSSETTSPRENQNSLAAANLPTPVAEIAMFIDGELAEEDDEDEDKDDELNSEKEDKDILEKAKDSK